MKISIQADIASYKQNEGLQMSGTRLGTPCIGMWYSYVIWGQKIELIQVIK